MTLEQALALWPDTDLDVPRDETYPKYLENKLGQRYKHLRAAQLRYETDKCKSEFFNMFDFIFDNDLYNDLAPRTALRGQYAFLSLLNKIPDKPLDIIDL